MPGRFPLVAVPLTNDSFCEDGFCDDTGGGGGGGGGGEFDPFAYQYVRAAVTIQKFYSNGGTLAGTTTFTTDRKTTAGLLGFSSDRITIGFAAIVSPVGPSNLWETSGSFFQIEYTYGTVPLLPIYAEYSDGPKEQLSEPVSIALTPSGPGIPPPPYPIVMATQQTTFSFYDSLTGPVVATWPGFSWN